MKASLIIGINIIYYELFKGHDPNTRLIIHFLYTFLFIVISCASLKIRERKFNKEYQPLIDELTLTLDELEKI